jgi:hypothetical protein
MQLALRPAWVFFNATNVARCVACLSADPGEAIS